METGAQFNECATAYAQYRMTYPDSLFSWLSTCTPCHQCAWDAGTGNGQAALPLTEYFDRVLATDSGDRQLEQAVLHPKITYQCVAAEEVSLPAASVDLITAACAVHWFDLPRFYQKCQDVLKPTGVIAVWTYSWPEIDNPAVSQAIEAIKNTIFSKVLNEKVNLHVTGYRNLYFPFEPIQPPSTWVIEKQSSLNALIGFCSTSGSVQEYITSVDPHYFETIQQSLTACWPGQGNVLCRFPLFLKVGKLGT